MKVLKFGGASINSIDRIKNVGNILSSYKEENILVVISAMGKVTNALEKVTDAFYRSDKEETLGLFEEIKQSHLELLHAIVTGDLKQSKENLLNFFTEVEWLLHDKPVKDYDYYYDQIVCTGELLSTSIVSAYLNDAGIKNSWIDVRDVMRTDDNFRDAYIDQPYTLQKIHEAILPLFQNTNIVITQGFIGSTDENESTTLGREGSDYTAAVFANMLGAQNVTIWKDVEGVMNADPKEFKEAKFIASLSYDEIIEMAYYGAQVIHPKTIKPLQNKNIPLLVKCFLNPLARGTLISSDRVHGLPPIIVLKQKQVLLQLIARDFSFVGEEPVSRLYKIFAEIKIKPNLTQNGAITLFYCLDDMPEKIERLALAASVMFDVAIEKDLTLLTIRHYNKQIIDELTTGRFIVLEQKTPETIQVLMRGS
jgi:aspartate kinase